MQKAVNKEINRNNENSNTSKSINNNTESIVEKNKAIQEY